MWTGRFEGPRAGWKRWDSDGTKEHYCSQAGECCKQNRLPSLLCLLSSHLEDPDSDNELDGEPGFPNAVRFG